jgi:predicted AAA+ superfamily ATPase
MEEIKGKSDLKISRVPTTFKRFVYNDILKTRNRLIALLGARGTGKTTLLLQLGKEKEPGDVLYMALDDLFFTRQNLYETAETFNNLGGRFLLLDEVHKYPGWSREIKLIYDDFPDMYVIFTSSSILDIYKGESDLSRRVVSIKLPELSFREYLHFYHGIQMPVLQLRDIIKEHNQITLDLVKGLKPLKFLFEFIQIGNYPYYEGSKDEYYQKILNTLNLILDIDIQSIESLDYQHIAKMKKLLFIISTNVPFIPNISKLSERIGLTRNSLVQSLQMMEKAELIHTLTKEGRSISTLSKPDKIWLHNTNLYYALSGANPETGSLRETFMLQHLTAKHNVTLPLKGDFLVDGTWTFEVGGKSKTSTQIQGVPDAFLAKDGIETGSWNVIPLWLFGLLY